MVTNSASCCTRPILIGTGGTCPLLQWWRRSAATSTTPCSTTRVHYQRFELLTIVDNQKQSVIDRKIIDGYWLLSVIFALSRNQLFFFLPIQLLDVFACPLQSLVNQAIFLGLPFFLTVSNWSENKEEQGVMMMKGWRDGIYIGWCWWEGVGDSQLGVVKTKVLVVWLCQVVGVSCSLFTLMMLQIFLSFWFVD